MASPKKYLDEYGLIYLITKIAATFYQKPGSGIPAEDLSLRVRQILESVSSIDEATDVDAGLMSAADKRKLDSVNIFYNTTAYWNGKVGYIPPAGSIVLYSDHNRYEKDGQVYYSPGMKIGTGNAYVQDLAFMSSGSAADFLNHMADHVAHVTDEERRRWNNKLNIVDEAEVVGESLIFTRN